MVNRVLVWFSCGITSATAAKIAVDEYRGGRWPNARLEIASIDTGAEHADNWRFCDDVSNWLGVEIKRLKHPEYTSPSDVYDKVGFIKSQYGAPCSLHLKKRVREKYQEVGDLQVWGYDWNEESTRGRYTKFVENNPEIESYAPLVERRITKEESHRFIVIENGIARPITYDMGFKNANCLLSGCVKGGAGYWNHYRTVFPEKYNEMAERERRLGYAILKLTRNGEVVPVFLDELNSTDGNYDIEGPIQCGLFCSNFMSPE